MFINKIFSIIVTTFLFITLTACGSNSQAGEVGAQAEITDVPAGTESQEELDEEANTALPEVS